MANDLTFTQLSAILTDIAAQATGAKPIAPLNTYDFVSVAQTTLKQGYEPVLNAISQLVSQTIFVNRPYSRRFKGLETSEQRYGAITRKLSVSDKPFEEDKRMLLVDGESIDMQKVNKPNIIQTNFYGQNVYQKSYTIFKDQLDCAITGPEMFAEFISMVTTNVSDMVEQSHENTARATISNLIGGIIADKTNQPTRIIHLLSEYNAQTGQALTNVTVYEPANFRPFAQWMFARLNTLSTLMSERSTLFHTNITGHVLNRHTPKDMQRFFLLAQPNYEINTMAMADTYHDNYLTKSVTEQVSFWQSISSPDSIDVKPVYMDNTGTLKNTDGKSEIKQSKILGVVMDRDAAGYVTVNNWSAPSPFNAVGGYQNTTLHFTDKYWNDFTENAVVLVLD